MRRGSHSRPRTELVQWFAWGVPGYRQRFSSVASRPATERFYHLIRLVMAQAEQLRGPFDGIPACDETTFGGARKGERGWGAADKVIVFGIIKRNGVVKVQPIPAHDRASIRAVIQAESREGSLNCTDQWQAHATLRLRGEHVVLRKEKGQPRARSHQRYRGRLVHAKNALSAYPGIPKKFLHIRWALPETSSFGIYWTKQPDRFRFDLVYQILGQKA